MEPFLALITPLASQQPPVQPPWWPGAPTHPIPPGIWPQPPGGQPPSWAPHPEHPIPPTVWPTPPPGIGGQPPSWAPHPEHPIPPTVWPTPPPGSGAAPPYPDIGGPLPQPIPGWPPVAMPPIVIPPDQVPPGAPPWVSHPIPPTVWPNPPGAPEGERQKLIEWKAAWSPSTGWIVVGVPQIPVPTPAS
jgi:hypothetical protein